MFIIAGSRKSVKVDKNLGRSICPNCHHETEQALGREKTAATVFYIPILGWTTKRMILCPCCGEARSLSRAEYKEIKNR